MNECLFCKIVGGVIPSDKVYEDGEILAFRDIAPAAPIHVLIIPKAHIDGADDLSDEDCALVGRIVLTAKRIAEQLGLDNGWRLITNVKEDGGQTVRHLHFHLLGGRKLVSLC